MMTFRKLAAASIGKLIRAYFTEDRPAADTTAQPVQGAALDTGGRMTSYYTGDDRRASWRPDMPKAIAAALGIDPTVPPKDGELDRLFEAKRADTGAAWSDQKRTISAYDLTVAPHKSVTLAAEFAATPAETAMIRHAIDRAGDAAMRYVARELGWARIGHGGEDGAEPGAVGWAAFRHHTARPTLPVEDGPSGVTYLADVPIPGDPHDHIHYALFNAVATVSGRVGSLDTKRLQNRVHEFGAYFQALLADELRRLGVHTAYDKQEQAVVVTAIPQTAVDAFSKGRRATLRHAKAYAKRQGLNWDELKAEQKYGILAVSGMAARLAKFKNKNDREIWREHAAAIGWQHRTVLENAAPLQLTDEQRFDRAYAYVARHLAKEFRTAAVIDHDLLRTFAARGLIGTGIAGGFADIDHVVALVEQRGLTIEGEHAALITGMVDEKLRVTNTTQVRIEETLAGVARRIAGDRYGALSEAALTAAIDASGLDFEREPEHAAAQKAAIYALGMNGKLAVLTGAAGSGKSTLLQPLVAAYQADTTFSPAGREVIGLSTGWKQADALQDANIGHTVAVDPFLRSVAAGRIKLSRNNVIIIDEVSQIGPRSFLKLLELQAEHGFAIKGLGDQEQCQAIEAGDTIEILRRVLPKNAMPELLTTVRQETRRGREIAGLFRDGRAAEALAMKREDGTAWLVGGDQDQVIERIADLYMQRRDLLLASGAKHTVTVSALTNEDAADISRVIRARLKARGEIGDDERVYKAVSRGGYEAQMHFDLPLATGDKVRLYAKTYATVNGKPSFIGSNGHVLEVRGWTDDGIILRDAKGRDGRVTWDRLTDRKSGRLLLGFGHAVTVDSSQGMTTGEHINAMPRGSAGASGFKSYVAESRHIKQAFTVVSEAAVFEAVKHRRALGDISPVTTADLWERVAEDMSRKEYKPLGMDLARAARRDAEKNVDSYLQAEHRIHQMAEEGRHPGAEIRARLRDDAIARALQTQIGALNEALNRNGEVITELAQEVNGFLRQMRDQTAEIARRGVAAARERQRRQEAAAKPTFSPSPF